MAKYFGHRAKWEGGTKGTSSNFGVFQGGPVATTGTPNYNTSGGRQGQIIPPLSAGQHRRGKSLPGLLRTPASPSALAAARAAAMGKLAMRGLLGPLQMLEYIGNFTATWEWATQNFGVTNPNPLVHDPYGYTRWCNNSVSSCAVLINKGPALFSSPALINSACTRTDCANVGQYTLPVPLDTWLYYGNRRGVGLGPSYEIRVVWKADTTPSGTSNDLKWRGRKTMPFPATLAPPAPQVREKSYPRPAARPKDRYFGPGLPRRGSTKYPDYPHVPPPANVKEKKGLYVGGGRAAKIYGAATEFRDFADCLASNIPGNPCSRYRNQLHKYAACIAMNEAKINMPEAMVCFFEKQSEDKHIGGTFGHVGGAAAKTPNWVRPVGPQAGGWATPRVPTMTPI